MRRKRFFRPLRTGPGRIVEKRFVHLPNFIYDKDCKMTVIKDNYDPQNLYFIIEIAGRKGLARVDERIFRSKRLEDKINISYVYGLTPDSIDIRSIIGERRRLAKKKTNPKQAKLFP